jgi:hypothetical protein
MAMNVINKTAKIATGSKAVFGNPFVGNDETIKQAFRQWLWFVHRGVTTTEAAIRVSEDSDINFNKKWIGPTREKLMQRLDALIQQSATGVELQVGAESHGEVIINYLRWRIESEKTINP